MTQPGFETFVAAALVLGALSACDGSAPGTSELTARESDRDAAVREIADRVSAYLDELARGAVDAAGDYYTADARLLAPGVDLDRAGTLELMRAVFEARTRVDVLERRTEDLFVHGDAAYEIARVREVFTPADGAPPDTVMNNLFVRWEKGADGRWRFDRVVIGPQATSG